MNKWEEAALNSDQASYVRSLEAIPPEQRCYCGYRLGECPHCPAGKTCADKLRDRGNDRVSSVCQCNKRRMKSMPTVTTARRHFTDAIKIPLGRKVSKHPCPICGVKKLEVR